MMFSLLAVAVMAQTTAAHPSSAATLQKFAPHFRCPYANEWLSKGPEQAALDLGLRHTNLTQSVPATVKHQGLRRARRAQQEQQVAKGSCTYTNPWSGQPACLEMRGEEWSNEAMEARCASEPDSTLTLELGCDMTQGEVGGWCMVTNADNGGVEATPLPVMPGMECAQLQSTCETFMGGSFEADSGCATNGDNNNYNNASDAAADQSPFAIPADMDGEEVTCAIAPGAIGAGHQAGYSSGYGPDCQGTPAEGSPYMWPMAWMADTDAKSMQFGSDDILYHSQGRVAYRMDKNWKRHDWFYQRGVHRGPGRDNCPPENIDPELSKKGINACRLDTDEYQSMIHRGGKMFFFTWKNGTEPGSSDASQIEACEWMNMQVVGNIRPDWFLDDRGDSTDAQFLGKQHVYYQNQPRLVQQWRKQDFANQYFTMSMQENVLEEDGGIHWPLILNVPGEGFGDDFLQLYANHTLLTDDDDDIFLLDQALEALGGECPEIVRPNGGAPPKDREHLPSNLEVDPNAWISNVYTYSPIWEPPVETDGADLDASSGVGRATTEAGSVVVTSCYDAATQAVELSVEFMGVADTEELPWMGLGYRPTDECKMNPTDGSDSEVIFLVTDEETSEVKAQLGMLPAAARGFNEQALTSIYESMTPLSDMEGYSKVQVEFSSAIATARSGSSSSADDSVVLYFQQSMSEVPEVMHLMYAIGSSSQLGIHKTRQCFEITEFPTCPGADSAEMNGDNEMLNSKENSATSSAAGSLVSVNVASLTAAAVGVMLALVL